MTLKQIYQAVSRQAEMNEGRFISLYKTTVDELCGQYCEKFICPPDISLENVSTINGNAANFPEYDACIISNILYLNAPENTAFKEMSLSQREYAYRTVWSKNVPETAKCRRWH